MPSSTRAVPCWLKGEQSAISPAPAIEGGTEGAWTGTEVVPSTPSLVALMLALPVWSPTTKPLAFTTATAGALLAQVTVRPLSTLPLASLVVAVSCIVPFAWIVGVGGVRPTEATGASVTRTVAEPLFPSLVAVIVIGPPAAIPMTPPLASTPATAGLALCHVTVRPLSGLPFASLGVAVRCTLPLTRMLEDTGVTVTDATGIGVTVLAAVPLLPSLVAVMVAGPPAPVPVTRPFASTVAMAGLLVCHVTVRPLSGLPFASFGVAVSWTVAFS